MSKVPSLRAGAAAAMTKFKIHLTTLPPTSAPPPSDCDAWKYPYTGAEEFKANMAFTLTVLISLCALICILPLKAAICYLMRLHCHRKAEIRGVDAEERAEVPELIYDCITSYAGMKLGGEETECIICLSDFTAGERIRVLDKCNHGFHADCVQRWLTFCSSCPTCRTNCAGEEFHD